MCGKAPAVTQNTDWFGAPQPGDKFPKWMGHKKRALEAPFLSYLFLLYLPARATK